MLWQIENTPHRLLGSVHVLTKEARLPSWAETCSVGMERFVFEADHRDPAIAQVGLDPQGACWEGSRADRAYGRAADLLDSIGVTDDFDGLKPWRAAFYLVFQFMGKFGLSHEHGMDNLLRSKAEADGLQVEYLETPARSFDLLEESCRENLNGLGFFEDAVDGIINGKAARNLKRIMRNWIEADLGDTDAFRQEQEDLFPYIFNPLISVRNREWAPVADALIANPSPTLIAVGAMHTVGAGSIIEELRALGHQFRLLANGEEQDAAAQLPAR